MAVREPLSVVVLTRNDERNLDRCLASVAWAEEILVVDSASTDRTREIAKRHRARILEGPRASRAERGDFALAQAGHLWVLVLAAQEWLPEDTSHEIRAVLEAPLADGYSIPRATAFSGAFVRWVWRSDRPLRLLRKDRGSFDPRAAGSLRLEEGCRVERLRGRVFRLADRSVGELVDRINRASGHSAAQLDREGRRFSILHLLFGPPAAFVQSYVLRLGILDGMRGLVASAGNAAQLFFEQAKLWELRRDLSPEFLQIAGTTSEDPDPGDVPQEESTPAPSPPVGASRQSE